MKDNFKNNSDECGVFKIKNIINNNEYIGMSVCYKQTKHKYSNLLKTNNHFNTLLQNDFNNFGEENFIFLIIEILENSKNIHRFEKIKILNEKIKKHSTDDTILIKDITDSGYIFNKNKLFVTNKHSGETVTIDRSIKGSIKEFCEERKINYQKFYRMTRGNLKLTEDGWFLGNEETKTTLQKGKKS